MSIGRRKVRIDTETAWVFNRMVDAYEARPPYPSVLLDALSNLAAREGARIADIGAGLGHVALPLAERGFEVTAVEPAAKMLQRLRTVAEARCVSIETVHAKAEALPLGSVLFDLVIVSDAVHFMDSERAAYELSRVLTPNGALALITCEFAATPFMRAVAAIMQDAAPRRPRDVSSALTELLAVSRVRNVETQRFEDRTRVDAETLERILRSISFIGPAMNPERFAAFRKRIHAIEHDRCWARSFTLHAGRR